MTVSERHTTWALAVLAIVHFLLHMLTNGHYGMFRDEYYYIACANHLAWGYVDQPPASIAVLALWKGVFGDSIVSVRIVPALAGAYVVLLAGLMAREMGGGRFAQLLAAGCVMISPTYLVNTGFFSMNAIDLVVWATASFVLIRLINSRDVRLWWLLGLILGVGLMNKLSVFVLGVSITAATVLTPLRSHLRRREPWLALALAAVIFLPHVVWQVTNGWPTFEFIDNAKRYKMADIGPIGFFIGQIMDNHPVNFAVWLCGLVALVVSRRLRKYRFFFFLYVAAFIVFVVQRSKVYYLSPVYTVMFAAGAVAIEDVARRRYWGWLRWYAAVSVVVAGLITLPFGVPILSADDFIGYQAMLGLAPKAAENSELGALPQYYADRFGWENMVAVVADVYGALSADEKAQCAIYARNYGEAGALNYHGRRLGLPEAVSGHNSYFFWGPGERSGEVTIAIGVSRAEVEATFEHVEAAATVVSPHAMPYESDVTVFIGRGPKRPFAETFIDKKIFI